MSSNNILYIPHIGLGGGAGKYNYEVYSIIKDDSDVIGMFSSEYSRLDNESYSFLNSISFVNYSGVSTLKRIYWLFLSIFRLCYSIFNMFSLVKEMKRRYSNVIYTSSIQLFYGPIFKFLGYKGRQTIIIQENLQLDGFFGYLTKYMLKKFDVVISITEHWSNYAKSHQIDSKIIYNPFPNKRYEKETYGIEYDVLYVGGGGKIKGFDVVCDFFELAASKAKIRFAFLGSYNENEIEKLRLIHEKFNNANGSVLELIGLVESIEPYVCTSKILLIPIMSPHFCRPAIEAGFINKSFIISDFDSLNEFAVDGYNCVKFKCGDVRGLHEAYNAISKSKLETLQDNNNKFCNERFSYNKFSSDILELIYAY